MKRGKERAAALGLLAAGMRTFSDAPRTSGSDRLRTLTRVNFIVRSLAVSGMTAFETESVESCPWLRGLRPIAATLTAVALAPRQEAVARLVRAEPYRPGPRWQRHSQAPQEPLWAMIPECAAASQPSGFGYLSLRCSLREEAMADPIDFAGTVEWSGRTPASR